MFLALLTITQNSVEIGSWQHLLPVFIIVLVAILFIRYAKRHANENFQHKAINVLGCLVSAVVISYHIFNICIGDYNFKTDLPLYLCSLLAVLIPIFTYYRKYWMFEILLFWIIGGTLQGVITPDISKGFPSFDYFRYWTVHLGLLSIIFYFILVYKMKPTLKSVFKSFFALQFYVILMIIINHLLNANYFYLNEKPKSASLLDYFGEWPYYIVVGQIIIIPLFLLIYLPFYISKENRSYLANS